MWKFVYLLLTTLLCYKYDCTKPRKFHNNRPNRNLYIYAYLNSNSQIELCSANLEMQDTYRLADIDFCFQM
jgi:hypothetical protein